MRGGYTYMEKRLDNKVVVITGASSGFGKGAALKLSNLGASVVLAARRGVLLDEIVMQCRAQGSQAVSVETDVSKEADVEALYAKALAEFGKFDVWINNAGSAVIGYFQDVPLKDHIKVIETDLNGTIYGCYFALKEFRKHGEGVLINVASMIGKIPAPYYTSYAAAKHGVVGLSAGLRQELMEQKLRDIHVCTVLPMAMDTDFFDNAANYSGHKAVPIPPVNEAEKVVDVLVDLVSNPKPESPVGTGSGVFTAMDAISPGLTEAMMAKNTSSAQKKAPPAPPTEGNL